MKEHITIIGAGNLTMSILGAIRRSRDKFTIKNQAAYRGHDVGKNFCEAYFTHRFIA